MLIGGADFSGAKSPTLYYVTGWLDSDRLTLARSVVCDDRLDLFAAMQHDDACQGLDCPFALSEGIYQQLAMDREAFETFLIEAGMARSAFYDWIAERLTNHERRCTAPHPFCRATDVAVQSYSGLKKYNPGMQAMVYSGFKLLAYLKQQGALIYPFDADNLLEDGRCNRIYEVYPSATWRKLGLKRSTDLQGFVRAFAALNLIEVVLPANMQQITNQDLADSVVVCITLAAAIRQYGLQETWQTRPAFVTDAEWTKRQTEGLIVRL